MYQVSQVHEDAKIRLLLSITIVLSQSGMRKGYVMGHVPYQSELQSAQGFLLNTSTALLWLKRVLVWACVLGQILVGVSPGGRAGQRPEIAYIPGT